MDGGKDLRSMIMSRVLIPFTIKQSFQKETVMTDLCWYDNLKGQMINLKCSMLGFEFKEDDYLVEMGENERKRRGIKSTYRMLPKEEYIEIVNYNKPVRATNEEQIDSWYNSYINYNDSESERISSDDNGIEFEVPEHEISDFIYAAEREGLKSILL